jgi:hypothetical protein
MADPASENRKTYRAVCFTYFLEADELFDMPPHDDYLRWVFQEEVCPDTGRHHIQGYMAWNSPKHFGTIKSWLKDNLLDSMHIESARGTYIQNYAYCTKGESRAPNGATGEFGDFSPNRGQGARNDLLAVKEAIKAGKRKRELVNEFFPQYVRYGRGLREAQNELTEPRMCKPEEMDCRWYYGGSGIGKTRVVYDEFGLQNIYRKKGTTKWWDKYDHEKVVLVNEYRRSNDFDYTELLELMDVYPFAGETKGGHVEVTSKTIVVTSSQPPWKLFSEERDPRLLRKEEPLCQLERRCQIFELTAEGRVVQVKRLQ